MKVKSTMKKETCQDRSVNLDRSLMHFCSMEMTSSENLIKWNSSQKISKISLKINENFLHHHQKNFLYHL